MGDSTDNNTDKSVMKETAKGIAIGSAVFPAVTIAMDALSKNKSFVPGNRLKFIASDAAMGAVVMGIIEGISAWRHNRKNSQNKSHVEMLDEQKIISASTPQR